jgi:hypothetical protein
MSFEKIEVFGDAPLPRFGHSITYYAKNKVCLFGGATGTTGQFSITDNTYSLDLATKFWRRVQSKVFINVSDWHDTFTKSRTWCSFHWLK